MNKNTIIALLVFVVLLIVVLVAMGDRDQRGITRIGFEQVDPTTIDRIVISGKNPVELKKEGGVWKVADGREADPNSIERLLEAIPKIQSSDLVTRDQSRFSEFEVDLENGSKVEAFSSEKKVAGFVVGKSSSGGANILVDNEVYLVKKVYPYLFSKTGSAWYKLKLFDLKLEEIAKANFYPQGASAFTLTKKEDQWQLEDPSVVPDGFRFDSSEARSLVSALVNLRAKEVLTETPAPEQTGLEQPSHRLVLTDTKDKQYSVVLGNKNDQEDFYLKIEEKPDVYLLSQHTAKSLQKTVLDLRDLKLMALDTDKVTKFSIKDGKKALVLEKQGKQWKIGKSTEKIPQDFELDEQLVLRRLSSLSSARATQLANDKSQAATGLGQPEASLEAVLEDGKLVRLLFGKLKKEENKELVFAKGNVDEEIYLVANWTKNNLMGGLDSFKKRPMPQQPGGGMPDLDPQALQNLPPEVRQQLMQQMQQKQREQAMMQRIQEQLKQQQESQKTAP